MLCVFGCLAQWFYVTTFSLHMQYIQQYILYTGIYDIRAQTHTQPFNDGNDLWPRGLRALWQCIYFYLVATFLWSLTKSAAKLNQTPVCFHYIHSKPNQIYFLYVSVSVFVCMRNTPFIHCYVWTRIKRETAPF